LNKSLLGHITNSEFSKSLRDDSIIFENKAKIGICVSGGSDSMALAILMNNWIRDKDYSLEILYYNHK
jgi:tRNA(Ile)-lysidine synthase TilS/MesJ